MTKILSAVQANPDYYQNVTQKSRKRATAAGRNFVGRSPSGARRLGVWEVDGCHLHPILIFIDHAPVVSRAAQVLCHRSGNLRTCLPTTLQLGPRGCNRDGEALV